ncbi:site-specific integrase [Streptomyces sp. NBC_00154]|uniref:tyrosine-type recombinase/integrase n=1 Tax=Streptomyces sp. NBC_00154 TaxID=2975670 RepID=UPI0022594655|nr:site-specific integrase [Streptomyces sp. NBC_00154]MCX5317995.1 tyrosine-type recombinase/integrase [Streptomyces sp. NBC_00154]
METTDPARPYMLLDSEGAVVTPVTAFFAELQACARPRTTIRSYGMDLLRWWRFLAGWGVDWNRATRLDARDFARWMQIAPKPARVHWRHRASGEMTPTPTTRGAAGVPNAVTGRAGPGRLYSMSTRAHCETVLRSFYAFHLEEGTGPIINPFPAARERRRLPAAAGRSARQSAGGRYRPSVPHRLPRRIPDSNFNELFAALRHNRDRALLAFWVSNGARASELLTSRQRDPLPGEQLLGVIRKGTAAFQQLPSSPDAFVWLLLYQDEAWRAGVPRGGHEALWWTLRRPFRPLTYHAARAMLNRANELLGANWTLHDLRHTAAYRMARDPGLALTDLQWVLGHAHLSTTQIYLPAGRDEIVEAVRAHHERQALLAQAPAAPAAGYRADSLNDLFGVAG